MASQATQQHAGAKSGAAAIRLGLLAGDGIGPEITTVAAEVAGAACSATGARPLEWVELPVGWEAIDKGKRALPAETVLALGDLDGWLLGPVDFVSYPADERQGRNPSGELRHSFDLYANVRPARTFRGIDAVITDADLVIVRENTEGFYADRNMRLGAGDLRVTDDVALAVGVFTRAASERIGHVACRLALGRRRLVSIVHKANVLPNSMGLFLDAARSIAETYDVECNDFHADAMAAHLVRRYAEFDVVVCENFIGDVFSDLAGELTGSLGLAPSLNVGDDRAMAQAAHGSAPDIAGKNVANPVGEMLSTKMLLEWLASKSADLALTNAARAIESAIEEAFADGVATPDIGGDASTTEFAAEVTRRVQALGAKG